MAELILPSTRVRQSFLAAMAEFREGGSDSPVGDDPYERVTRKYASRWGESAEFACYVHELRIDALKESPRPDGLVPQTTLWWVVGDEYLGRVSIRHGLTPSLRERGGHIGYQVRPSARRRGHAGAMLAAALPCARALGIDPALLMCDADNIASRKVIGGNGGILEGLHDGRLWYWVPTS